MGSVKSTALGRGGAGWPWASALIGISAELLQPTIAAAPMSEPACVAVVAEDARVRGSIEDGPITGPPVLKVTRVAIVAEYPNVLDGWVRVFDEITCT